MHLPCCIIILKIIKKEYFLAQNRSVLYVSLFIFFCAIFSYFYVDKFIAIYFHNFNSIANHACFSSFFRFITKLGESQYALIILFSLFISLRKKFPIVASQMIYLFSAVALSGIVVDIVKIIFARLRPNMLFEHDLYGFVGFKIGSQFNSLPSGHSATAFALAIGLALLFPRYKYLYFIIAIFIASSRVILTFHYLSDVLIGSLFGGLLALLLYKVYIAKIVA